jgi:hypothetical protein
MKKRARNIAKGTQKGTKEKLNARLVRQWLRGQKAMNKITQAEERVWAARLTPRQARQLFHELNSLWEKSGSRADGNWEAVERLRFKETLRTQRRFVLLARRIKIA